MKITLEGLSRRQRMIADLLWNCGDEADMQRMIDAMPPEYKQSAETVRELMIAAVFDTHMDVDANVKDYISSL